MLNSSSFPVLILPVAQRLQIAVGLLFAGVLPLAAAAQTMTGSALPTSVPAPSAIHLETSKRMSRPVSVSERAAVTEEKTASEPNDVSHQGVKVHGHWKIVVRNADGSVAHDEEFENALVDGGTVFSYSLAGYATLGEPKIVMSGAGTPCDSSGSLGQCIVALNPQGYWSVSSNGCTATPSVCTFGANETPVTTGPANLAASFVSLKISGSFPILAQGTLSTFQTWFSACQTGTRAPNGTLNLSATALSAVTPAQCLDYASIPQGSFATTTGLPLTQVILLNPITVTSGQTVNVTVTLSFS